MIEWDTLLEAWQRLIDDGKFRDAALLEVHFLTGSTIQSLNGKAKCGVTDSS